MHEFPPARPSEAFLWRRRRGQSAHAVQYGVDGARLSTGTGPRHRVGVFGPCEYGPTVVVYPDATWYAQVKEADVAAILDEHIGKGTPVERLKPNSVWG